MHEPRDPPLKVIILYDTTFSFSVRRRRFDVRKKKELERPGDGDFEIDEPHPPI